MSANLLAAGLLIAILIWICIQDFKERKVYLFCYPLLMLSVLFVQYTHCGFGDLFKENFLVNNCILLFQFGMIAVYFKWVRNLNIGAAIGAGDILFYFCLTPFMSVPIFIAFNIASLLVVIVAYLLFKKQLKINKESIPLAGIQAGCLIVVQLFDCCYISVLGTCYIPEWIIQ